MASSAKLVLGLAALLTFAANASSSGLEQLSTTPEWDLSFIESLKSPGAKQQSNITKPKKLSLIETWEATKPAETGSNEGTDGDDEAFDTAIDSRAQPLTLPKFLQSSAPPVPSLSSNSKSLEALSDSTEALSDSLKEDPQPLVKDSTAVTARPTSSPEPVTSTPNALQSAGGNKNTAATMESELMNLLLGKSAFGGTPMGGSVKKIHNILTKDMKPKVLDAHKGDQNELNKLMRELKKCFSTRDKSLRGAAPYDKKYKMQSKHHKVCRSDEAVKYSSKEACVKQQRALYEIKKLKCTYYALYSTKVGSTVNNVAIVTKAGSESVQSYIKRLADTICGKHVHGEKGLKKLPGGWGGGLLDGMLEGAEGIV